MWSLPKPTCYFIKISLAVILNPEISGLVYLTYGKHWRRELLKHCLLILYTLFWNKAWVCRLEKIFHKYSFYVVFFFFLNCSGPIFKWSLYSRSSSIKQIFIVLIKGEAVVQPSIDRIFEIILTPTN